MIIDKFIKYKKKFLSFFFIPYYIIIFISFVHCQNDTNIDNSTNLTEYENTSFDAKCNGNSLNYYILANLKKYLENLSNNFSQIERKPIYSSIEDIKNIGFIEGTVYEKITKNLNIVNNKTYKSYDDIKSELKHNLINAFITSKEYGDIIKMDNGDLTYFYYNNKENIVQYKLFFKNSDNNLINGIKFQIYQDINELKIKWFGCDNNFKYINKNITGKNGNLNVALKINEPPFCYLDSKGEYTGLIIDLLYRFAKESGYNLNITQLENNDNFNETIINNKYNFIGFLSLNESLENDIISVNIFENDDIKTVLVIKNEYSNNTKFLFYDSIEEFYNEKLGVLNSTIELTEEIFNNSENIFKENVYELYNSLLVNEINGFLIDEMIAEYYEKKVSDRLIYFPKILSRNHIGFIFTNETITKQFNEFFGKIKNEQKSFYEILNEFYFNNITENNLFNFNYLNDLNNLNYNETINVIIDKNIYPFVYIENGIYKGYEINLLYNFSYQYNYTLIFNNEYEISNETNNVYIGYLNISNDTDLGYFTDSIYESNIVFTTRKDKLKKYITIKTLDSKYREKANNDLLFTIKFSGTQKTCFCIVPTKYNDNISLECSIFGLYSYNRFNGHFEYSEINNKIKIMNTTIEADNFIKANSIFPEDNIINQSNMINIICPNNSNNNKNMNISSSGFKVTTASIIGLALVGVLFAAAILTIIIMYSKEIKSPKVKRYELMNSSSAKLNIKN